MYDFMHSFQSRDLPRLAANAKAILLVALMSCVVIVNDTRRMSLPTNISTRPNITTGSRLSEAYGKLPMRFEANQGQADGQVKFLSRGSGHSLFLTSTEAVLALCKPAAASRDRKETLVAQKVADAQDIQPRTAAVLRMKLMGANPGPVMSGLDELPGKSNYFIGNDPSKWRTDVPNYARVEYHDVYPGVNLVYYGNQSQLESDFVVAPTADPSAIKLQIEGADKVELDARGDLILHTTSGEARLKKPHLYQEVEGSRVVISGGYVTNENHMSFWVGEYDTSRRLIIDPVLYYVNLGGIDSRDRVNDMAVDAAGNVYITGYTHSYNFPLTPNPFQSNAHWAAYYPNAFVTKLNASGTALIYSTYLGGYEGDEGNGIAVDDSGNAYVTGYTSAGDFPLANPLQGTFGGIDDAFVTKLNGEGNTLIYSTFLGGSDLEGSGDMFDINERTRDSDIAVDSFGNAYIVGSTQSLNFPTTPNAFQTIKAVDSYNDDAFITKLNASGTALIYSTYLGGNSHDVAKGIAIDANGNAFVTGVTGVAYSSFPTMNAFQSAYGGWGDAFVTKVNSSGSALVYSTYLGGASQEEGESITVDKSGNAYVIGWTTAASFPTFNPIQDFGGGQSDAFVTKFNETGNALIYSTFLGGGDTDKGFGIAVDETGNTYVTGGTSSTDFPTASPLQSANGGLWDAFVAKLNQSGSALTYSTYLGIGDGDEGYSIAVDQAGNIYVAGKTGTAAPNPYNTRVFGFGGTFITKIGEIKETREVQVWQEIPLYSTAGQFSTPAEANLVTFDGHPAKVKKASPDSLIVRVPEQLVGPRVGLTTWPDTTRRKVKVVVKIARAPGDSLVVYEEEVIFIFPRPLLFDEVTRSTPPLVQDVVLDTGAVFRESFMFLGGESDGVSAVRVSHTSTALYTLSLILKVISPTGVLFDASSDLSSGNMSNLGIGNAGVQFPVSETGLYLIVVEASRWSSGPFPSMFQIHLAGNVGLPLDFPRGTRLDTYFNHPAPREEILANAAPELGEFAETALFKFGKPLSTSQFAIAVLVPPAGNPGGFPIFPLPIAPVRAAPPLVIVDLTVPSARTPDAATPVPGTVVDFAQVPIPASPLIGGSPPGIAAILGTNNGHGVTLPITLTSGVISTSLLLDMGSGNEIVNGTGSDLKVFGLGGSYDVAVSNTPFADDFKGVGTGTDQTEFDIAGTGFTSVRYVRVSVSSGSATIDAVQSLHFFVDAIHPTIGPIADVGWATITMRRQKSPRSNLDPFLELIAVDGSLFTKNESGFGDDTETDRSDAAIINIALTQQGFYRYLGRGYDWQADAQAFGSFFTRLETGGNYDPVEIPISSASENQTAPQKQGLINQPRQRDSYLFQAAPGTTVSIVVNSTGDTPLPDPLVELYDPEDFFIAANDNFPQRGRNAALTVSLPDSGHGGGLLPNPSTYRIVVMGIDKASAPPIPTQNGTAYLRQVNGGNYEVKVFTGPVSAVQEPQVSPLPTALALYENYPNPFNPSTTIEFALPKSSRVRLAVYSVLGQLEATLVDEHRKAGYHAVVWNAARVASGIYFARLEANGEARQIKMMVLK